MLILKEKRSDAGGRPRRVGRGGNRKPRTYSICPACLCVYGPPDRRSRRYCSSACKEAAQRTGRRRLRRATAKARSAQSLVRYHVKAGNLARPGACEACGTASGRIEAAHFDYDQPLRVRWLCRSCHVRWDRREPKGGTRVIGPRAMLASHRPAPTREESCP